MAISTPALGTSAVSTTPLNPAVLHRTPCSEQDYCGPSVITPRPKMVTTGYRRSQKKQTITHVMGITHITQSSIHSKSATSRLKPDAMLDTLVDTHTQSDDVQGHISAFLSLSDKATLGVSCKHYYHQSKHHIVAMIDTIDRVIDSDGTYAKRLINELKQAIQNPSTVTGLSSLMPDIASKLIAMMNRRQWNAAHTIDKTLWDDVVGMIDLIASHSNTSRATLDAMAQGFREANYFYLQHRQLLAAHRHTSPETLNWLTQWAVNCLGQRHYTRSKSRRTWVVDTIKALIRHPSTSLLSLALLTETLVDMYQHCSSMPSLILADLLNRLAKHRDPVVHHYMMTLLPDYSLPFTTIECLATNHHAWETNLSALAEYTESKLSKARYQPLITNDRGQRMLDIAVALVRNPSLPNDNKALGSLITRILHQLPLPAGHSLKLTQALLARYHHCAQPDTQAQWEQWLIQIAARTQDTDTLLTISKYKDQQGKRLYAAIEAMAANPQAPAKVLRWASRWVINKMNQGLVASDGQQKIVSPAIFEVSVPTLKALLCNPALPPDNVAQLLQYITERWDTLAGKRFIQPALGHSLLAVVSKPFQSMSSDDITATMQALNTHCPRWRSTLFNQEAKAMRQRYQHIDHLAQLHQHIKQLDTNTTNPVAKQKLAILSPLSHPTNDHQKPWLPKAPIKRILGQYRSGRLTGAMQWLCAKLFFFTPWFKPQSLHIVEQLVAEGVIVWE